MMEPKEMTEKVVVIKSVGNPDPQFSGLFEVALYAVKDGTYGDGNPLAEPDTFTECEGAERHAEALADEHGCRWEREWEPTTSGG